jgi:(+)-pinoresinol hydroxylase
MKRFWLLALCLTAAIAPALSAAGPRSGATADAARGKLVFERWCASCHARGPGHPGTQSLAIKYHGTVPEALEDRKDLSPQLTAYFVRNGVALMPFFRKTEVSDPELRDLSAYLARGAKDARR